MKKYSLKVLVVLQSFYFNTADSWIPKSTGNFNYGTHVLQGRRSHLEDAHIIKVPFFKEDPESYFFAIYDGHGGSDIAQYAADNVHHYVAESYSACHSIEQALIEGIEKTDHSLSTRSLRRKSQNCGCTAIISVLKDNKLYVANVGDSRAILSRNGIAIALSADHKPDRKDEKERIEQSGGFVLTCGVPRVNGQLAVSRAIGDHALRAAGVIATPEITVTTLTCDDDFIVLACDGVFETQTKIDNQVVISTVQQSLNENMETSDKADKAAKFMANMAYAKGSGDNISVMVITLK